MKSTNPTWDAGRFFKTLTYFEAIPVLSWFQRFLQSSPTSQSISMSTVNDSVILVAGASGGVGQRVVQQLVAQGYFVRALVRDLQRGQAIFGDAVEVIDGNVTIPETLTAAVVKHVRAVIWCIGPRVQPVEGDTPDRAKYYQGIKFYLPEVVGDTPEAVDYQGIQHLLAAVGDQLRSSPTGEKPVFDFSTSSRSIETWGALDDVVMGGVSEGSIRWEDQAALFVGNVSTANSGGFSSIRTRNLAPVLDLSDYEGIKLRVRGDGNRYKCLLRSDDRWDSLAYSYSFDTVATEWIDVSIPFSSLIPVFRAKTLPNAEPLNTSRICSFQLMLSKFEYDGGLNPKFQAGSFALSMATITAYGGPILPKFVLVSSAGVTRPTRPGINLEEEPPAVRLNDQLGGILTWKLRGEAIVRESGIPYTIIRPCALTEEPGGKQLTIEQGDNLRGKISRTDVATLCVQALNSPNACNTTFEVRAEDAPAVTDGAALFSGLQVDRSNPTAS